MNKILYLLILSLIIFSCEEKEVIKVEKEKGLYAKVKSNGDWNEQLLTVFGSKIKESASEGAVITGEIDWTNKEGALSPDISDISIDNNNDFETTDILKGRITSNMTLEASKIYELVGDVYVEPGVTLTIPPGTKVFADSSNDEKVKVLDPLVSTVEYINATDVLIIKQGGKIIANGTKGNPILFVGRKEKPWGGIVILGKAPTNTDSTAPNIIKNVTDDKLVFGGSDSKDSSGEISYVIVGYGGAEIDKKTRYSGFSFYGVGSGTVLNNLEAYNCKGDSFKWFGGTVNASNLYGYGLVGCEDIFDWSYGYTGILDNIKGVNTAGDHGFCIAGGNIDSDRTPISNPVIRNATFEYNSSPIEAILLHEGTYATFENILITTSEDSYTGNINIKGVRTAQNVLDDNIKFNNINYNIEGPKFSGSK